MDGFNSKSIRICMINHDCFDRKDPRADLIRFKSLGEALSKIFIDVVYITSNQKWLYEKNSYHGSKIYKVPRLSKSKIIQLIFFYILVLPVLFKVKQTGGFDIIFVNSIFIVPIAWLLKKFQIYGNISIQYDLMGILSEEKFIRRPKTFYNSIFKKSLHILENYLWSHVDFITTINNQHKVLLSKRIKKPIYVVRDGVFESFLNHTCNVKKESINDTKIILIFVGQINYFRLDKLFKILPSLINEVPNLQFQILGEGPQLIRYKQMALNLGLEEHVTFLGHVPYEKIFEYISKADICYSDDWSINGFPMKLFEYMALGKAIVAEGTESVKEILKDQVNGLLYNDESELKEKIIALARDKLLRKKLGNNAKKVMDEHTWEKRGKNLETIYRKTIDSKKILFNTGN
jgi:glycosyltransferase involved in cell wall biosynthesis